MLVREDLTDFCVNTILACSVGYGNNFRHERQDNFGTLMTVDCRINVRLDLQAEKSSVVFKGPFFP